MKDFILIPGELGFGLTGAGMVSVRARPSVFSPPSYLALVVRTPFTLL